MRTILRRLATLACLLLATPTWGQPVTAGGELLASTFSGVQRRPAVATTADGGFVVVWESYGQDGYGYGIFGQRFDGAGDPLGTEFPINTYVPTDQARASVAADGDGGFVVVWQSYGLDGYGYGVFGQRFAADGARAGTEFRVNTYTTAAQRAPSVSPLLDGSFVVVWESAGQDGSGYGVFGQRFDASGMQAGAEFGVNASTGQGQYDPQVSGDASGDFVVVWSSDDGRDGSGSGVFGQRFGSDGSPMGTEFFVNTFTSGDQRVPTVASTSDGGFVVAWQSGGVDGSGDGIAGRRYDGAGAPLAAEFVVNTHDTGDQTAPAVSVDAAGGFVVVWQSDGVDGDGAAIIAQQFDGDGATTGPERLVNTAFAGQQRNGAVAADSSRRFVVVWGGAYGAPGEYGIFAQRYLIAQPECGDAVFSPALRTGALATLGPLPTEQLITATDALATLQASVSLRVCLLCVCDVNGSGAITATDALAVLSKSVGVDIPFDCPVAC